MHPVLGFVGPSGAGKTTLIMELFKRFPEKFGPVKTLTTRASRGTLDDPLFYDFTTKENILRLKDAGRIFQISEYAGNLYANDRATVDTLLDEKIGVMAIVEMGVKNFRAAGYDVIIVRVIPEDSPLLSDDARKKADEERAKEDLPAACTIHNSFASGGKEKAIEELLKFVETLHV